MLKHKILVLSQLRNYYETITKRRSFPPEIAQNCRDSVDDFQLHVEGIEKDMQVQILRLEWLLSLINDRKNLVGPSTPKSIVLRHTIRVRVDSSQKTQYGWVNVADTNDAQLKSILDYQNTKANKSSTHSMVIMTEDMNDIARKTKIETVSMKVITLVTLFFLPGNFNSVCRSFRSVSNRSPLHVSLPPSLAIYFPYTHQTHQIDTHILTHTPSIPATG